MNSCILMAEVTQDPQLRYTPDNQTPITEMWVQFPGLRDDDPPSTLKVLGWGNLAQEIQQQYHRGDKIIVEGRLNMNTIDRPEGFKEKRAELTANRIHRLNSNVLTTVASAPATTVPTSAPAAKPTATATRKAPVGATSGRATSTGKSTANSQPPAYVPDSLDYPDEIPF